MRAAAWRIARAAPALLVALLAVVGVLGATAGGASAASYSIDGTLRAGTTLVSGAKVSATPAAGGAAITATSGSDGRFVLPLPAAGAYRVAIDSSSLPKGISLEKDAPPALRLTVSDVRPSRPALFRLQSSASSGGARSANIEWVQLLVDGTKFGLIIAMTAIGLSLIFGTTGLTNFAHGEMVAFGALVAYFFNVRVGLPLVVAALLSMLAGGAAGGVLELGLWRPLRRRGTGLIAALVVSIGLSLLLRYIFLYIFGGSPRPYAQYAVEAGIDFGPFTMVPRDIVTSAIAIVVLAGVGLLLLRSRIGKAMRAVADNRPLAESSGIDVERIVLFVWVVGGGLAALGGVFLGMQQSVKWDMGFQLLLLMFAGTTLGGLGTAFGALVGSLIVGVLISESTLVIPVELKNLGALVALILILLVRPNGLLGRRERVG